MGVSQRGQTGGGVGNILRITVQNQGGRQVEGDGFPVDLIGRKADGSIRVPLLKFRGGADIQQDSALRQPVGKGTGIRGDGGAGGSGSGVRIGGAPLPAGSSVRVGGSPCAGLAPALAALPLPPAAAVPRVDPTAAGASVRVAFCEGSATASVAAFWEL